MSLTAHPYVVLAEQQWKQESLSGANLAAQRSSRRRRARRPRTDWHLPRPLGALTRHTPRPV
ncbi:MULTISPECIES: hypothetical protein [unclassified Phycicoccus]|uniref:hypothetical protein n=1 Tax=unclassified Phycicoccus TaxID=2637926 RepID=UPI0007024DA7|nr:MULTISPECIES: hypothetical protein [unclassified Phycicoccus]KRF24880.1 hypothetical protein ASG95_10465 [Phycicoccus sp. Soil803]KRF29967.1 hypothetical protein ASG91_03020 [Phycicoccus sp. Soil802]